MKNNLRVIFLYIPGLVIVLLALYRFENRLMYQGITLEMLPPGKYRITEQQCTEAGIKFDYTRPIPAHLVKSREMATFLGFYGENAHRMLIVGEGELIYLNGNKDCLKLIKQTITENKNGKLTTSGAERVEMVPAGCKLKYEYQGKVYVDDSYYKTKTALLSDYTLTLSLFQTKDSILMYEMAFDDDTYIGCSPSDRLVTVMERLDE
jgi:hypothetical protein